MNTYVIAFLLGMSFAEGNVEEALVEVATAPHYYFTKEECEESITNYGSEHIVNEFMSGLNEVEGITPFIKSMPFCTRYDFNTGQYPDFPEFDKPREKPVERMIENDGLGRSVSGSSGTFR